MITVNDKNITCYMCIRGYKEKKQFVFCNFVVL